MVIYERIIEWKLQFFKKECDENEPKSTVSYQD